MPTVKEVTIRFNFDAGAYIYTTIGSAIYNSTGTSISYYTANFTQEIANKYWPQKSGFLFLGWIIKQYNNRNPEGILNIGDSLYSSTSTFYLTSEWQEALVKNRILFKTDTVENWETQENTFETLKGELYFYKNTFDTGKINSAGNKIYRPQLKIGDGRVLSSLNFVANEHISLPDIYAIFYGEPNLVPFSTVSGGASIYNDIGYKEGYRLSSSGAEKAQTNSIVTGFIPATPKDIIRMSGVSWIPTVSDGYCYICFYDANYTLLATINEHVGGTTNGVSNISAGTVLINDKTAHTITTDSNGVYTFNLSYQNGAAFSYIRINAEGLGTNMIVTKNKEITASTNILDTSTLDSLILG